MINSTFGWIKLQKVEHVLDVHFMDESLHLKQILLQIEKMEKEKYELQFFLDMYGQECYDNRYVGK